MSRRSTWIVAGAIVLGGLIFGLSHVLAQREFRTSPRSGEAPFARYHMVSVNEAEVIIMDVTNGDLFSAKPKDVKPYASRPRPATANSFATDKDKAGYADKKYGVESRAKDLFKDKDRK
jgi:hypothetical protein